MLREKPLHFGISSGPRWPWAVIGTWAKATHLNSSHRLYTVPVLSPTADEMLRQISMSAIYAGHISSSARKSGRRTANGQKLNFQMTHTGGYKRIENISCQYKGLCVCMRLKRIHTLGSVCWCACFCHLNAERKLIKERERNWNIFPVEIKIIFLILEVLCKKGGSG